MVLNLHLTITYIERTMLLSLFFTLTGTVLTGLQVLLIFSQGEGICLNEGCEIVDALTLIPPLYFNIAGFIFFFLLSIGLGRARKGSELWQRFVSLLLLAGLCIEAVLVCFQFYITELFCSYCLIILALVVLANMFMGIRQIFRGIVLFSAIFMAFSSLDFSPGNATSYSLEDGSLASLKTESSDTRMYLFFSSSCRYCEDIIESMREEFTCNVNFNPVDQIESFIFPGAVNTKRYEPTINVNFLKHLNISEVPVLVVHHSDTTTILSGSQAISNYLEKNCRGRAPDGTPVVEPELQSSGESSVTIPLPPLDDGCSVLEECEETTATSTIK